MGRRRREGLGIEYIGGLKPEREVTLDVDVHLVETSKGNAQYCYEGYKAYQPIEVE